eukprot:scaffold48_cov311-Pinguiococcus_pyrenoidosus.AAC.314
MHPHPHALSIVTSPPKGQALEILGSVFPPPEHKKRRTPTRTGQKKLLESFLDIAKEKAEERKGRILEI